MFVRKQHDVSLADRNILGHETIDIAVSVVVFKLLLSVYCNTVEPFTTKSVGHMI